jgi:hypothetical protein
MPSSADMAPITGHLITAFLQMFLEYQNLEPNGLRRMMDAPIIATVQCHSEVEEDSSATDMSSTVKKASELFDFALCVNSRHHAAVANFYEPPVTKLSNMSLESFCRCMQLKRLEQCEFSACVFCMTHERMEVTASWQITRSDEAVLHIEASMLPDRKRRDAAAPRLFGEAPAVTLTSLLRTQPRLLSSTQGETGLGQSRSTAARITDAFVGAGTLTTSMVVGTAVGPQTCRLHGMFLQAGIYDISFEIEEVRELSVGQLLVVNDYAFSHPLQIDVGTGLDR